MLAAPHAQEWAQLIVVETSQGGSNELLTGLVGLLGGLAGAGAVVGAQWLQHRQAVGQEQAREARRRAVIAAEETDRLLLDLEILVPKVASSRSTSSDTTNEFDATERIRQLLVYLPLELRERIDVATNLLQSAGGLNGIAHYHSVGVIARNVVADAREAIAAFLRNEAIPPRGEYILEYEVALDEWNSEQEDFYAEEIAAEGDKRAAWLEGHPQLRDELERRRSAGNS